MKKPVIIMEVTKEDDGYTAVFSDENRFISTQGDDRESLMENILDAVNLSFSEEGFIYGADEIILRPAPAPAQSFF